MNHAGVITDGKPSHFTLSVFLEVHFLPFVEVPKDPLLPTPPAELDILCLAHILARNSSWTDTSETRVENQKRAVDFYCQNRVKS